MRNPSSPWGCGRLNALANLPHGSGSAVTASRLAGSTARGGSSPTPLVNVAVHVMQTESVRQLFADRMDSGRRCSCCASRTCRDPPRGRRSRISQSLPDRQAYSHSSSVGQPITVAPQDRHVGFDDCVTLPHEILDLVVRSKLLHLAQLVAKYGRRMSSGRFPRAASLRIDPVCRVALETTRVPAHHDANTLSHPVLAEPPRPRQLAAPAESTPSGRRSDSLDDGLLQVGRPRPLMLHRQLLHRTG